jgi:hypothetical protein
MRELKQIAFLLENFTLASPAQQILDRFLIGFPHAGEFLPPAGRIVLSATKEPDAALIAERKAHYGLNVVASTAEALTGCDAVVVSGATAGLSAPEQLVRNAIEHAPEGTPIFVQGVLASTQAAAASLLEMAAARRSLLLAGTAVPFAYRLPGLELPDRARVREALIVVQGELFSGELNGVEGLLPLLERRKNGNASVKRIRYLADNALWRAGEKGEWSWPLLAAALSRSHTPQGNAVVDGRTEDLVRLGLVTKLARSPRGWLLEHTDGLRSAILVLDGVVGDINVALSVQGHGTLSAQLFRPPPPQQEHNSRLAAALLDFFSSGVAPWPPERSLSEATIMAAMRAPDARSGGWIKLG